MRNKKEKVKEALKLLQGITRAEWNAIRDITDRSFKQEEWKVLTKFFDNYELHEEAIKEAGIFLFRDEKKSE